jgi:hypothetical protein
MQDTKNQKSLLDEFSGNEPPDLPASTLPLCLKNEIIGFTNAYDLVITVMKALMDGMPFTTACAMGGAKPAEVKDLMTKHRQVDMALNRAYAQNISVWIEKLKGGDWKAASFYLERGVPDVFAEARSTGKGALMPTPKSVSDANPARDYKSMSDEELLAIAEGLE